MKTQKKNYPDPEHIIVAAWIKIAQLMPLFVREKLKNEFLVIQEKAKN